GVDQPLRGHVHAPFHAAERRGRVKQVLPVMHIKHPVTPGRVDLVSRRQVNDHITIMVEELRLEIFVKTKFSPECVIRLQTLPLKMRQKILKKSAVMIARASRGATKSE